MRTFKTVQGNTYGEARYFDEHSLRNLEIIAYEVKCRKPCKCSICHRLISKDEIALKTSQRVDSRQMIWRQNYCSDCYQIVN